MDRCLFTFTFNLLQKQGEFLAKYPSVAGKTFDTIVAKSVYEGWQVGESAGTSTYVSDLEKVNTSSGLDRVNEAHLLERFRNEYPIGTFKKEHPEVPPEDLNALILDIIKLASAPGFKNGRTLHRWSEFGASAERAEPERRSWGPGDSMSN
jgi:hypothetical protein